MAVTAALVKELRERTGLGMMECKNALVETAGDIETAIDNLRKSGQAKAAKKAGRTAAEGIVIAKVSESGTQGILLEVNSETDFVARDDNFLNFANQVAQRVLDTQEIDPAKLLELSYIEGGEDSIEVARSALVQKIGENIQVRRAYILESAEGVVSDYVHSGKIGVLVGLKAGDANLAKDVAMHVAASNPLVVSSDQVDQATLDKEEEIYTAQAAESGKPADIVEKMVKGRISKFLKEVSLIDQPFVKDPDTSVGKLVKSAGAEVVAFIRIEVGEGIEKEVVDFASEVMAQVRGE